MDLMPPAELIISNGIGVTDKPRVLDEFDRIGRSMSQSFIRQGFIKPESHVLDLGCGLGRIARGLVSYIRNGSYTGIDVTKSSIEWCQRNYIKWPNFRFIHADLTNTHYNPNGAQSPERYEFPLGSNCIDFVWSASLFTHMLLKGVTQYLGEIARVLKPGGITVNTFFLLDEVSEPLARKLRPGQMWFSNPTESGLYGVKNDPEQIVAFYTKAIKDLHETHGLEIIRMGKGGWSGREDAVSPGQDSIVARKP